MSDLREDDDEAELTPAPATVPPPDVDDVLPLDIACSLVPLVVFENEAADELPLC